MLESTEPKKTAVTPTGCCPPFDPGPWNGREVVWEDHPFVREHVRSFLHIPLNMGAKILRAKAKIDAADAEPVQPLMLTDEKSPWGADLYIDVAKPVPGLEMATLSGTFLTRVYDGPFKDMGAWAQDMGQFVADKGRRLEKLYFAYTTCPACAKAYGHNYVVGFAKVAEPS